VQLVLPETLVPKVIKETRVTKEIQVPRVTRAIKVKPVLLELLVQQEPRVTRVIPA
jgi:hypothetical protein